MNDTGPAPFLPLRSVLHCSIPALFTDAHCRAIAAR